MLANYKHTNTVNYNGKDINYACIWYDNGITQYIFDKQLTDDEQAQVIDYITLYPFIV